jgi:hypothetical protein
MDADGFQVFLDGDVSLIVQWALMSSGSLVCVLQIYAYEKFKHAPSAAQRWGKASLATACWATLCASWFVGSLYLYRANVSDSLPVLFGSTIPTVVLAAGFFPQIWDFHKAQSGEAYSSGLAVLDSVGCVTASIAWIIDQPDDKVALIPYIVIFVLQMTMLSLKHIWYPRQARQRLPLAGEFGAPADDSPVPLVREMQDREFAQHGAEDATPSDV